MRILTYFFYCLVLFAIHLKSNISNAQTNVDSLKQLVTNESVDIEKASIFYELAEFYYYTNLDSALYYAQLYLNSSLDAKDTAWIADAQNYIAYVYDEKGEIELALEYFQRALENFLIVQDSGFIASCLTNIGYMTSYGKDQSKGLSYFLEAMQIAEAIKDSSLMADVGSNISYYYDRVGDSETAFRYAQKTLQYSLASQDSVSIALSYVYMAATSMEVKNVEEAKTFMSKAKQMISKEHTDYYLAYLYSSFVDSYIEWEQKDSAQHYINLSEYIINRLGNNVLRAYLYQQKGYLAYIKKEYNICIGYMDKSINLFNELNITEPLSDIYLKEAEAYAALQMHNEAYKHLHIASSLTDSLGFGILANMLGEFEQKRINRIENQKHKLEIELTNQQLENNRIKSNINLAIALSSILFFIFTTAILLYFFRKIRKKNVALKDSNQLIIDQKDLVELNLKKLATNEKKLRELNTTKDRFFSIIGHDLKNPFSALAGLTKLLVEDKELRESDKFISILENMNKTANHGHNLLVNLLDWSRSQTGALEPKPKKLLLSQTIEAAVQDFNAIASNKNIKLEYEADSKVEVLSDENMITTVLRNLIHNAVKFSYENGTVKIKSRKKEDVLLTSVEDFGIGATQKELSKLFAIDSNVKNVGTNNEKGTGLGLVLCKEFVTKNGGKIWVEGQENKGCKFSFTLPLYNAKEELV